MSFFKQLACCFLAGLCMFGVYGCSTEPSSNIPEEIALQPVADQIKPINIENDHNVDKVITEEKFQIPDELTTSASSFKLPALVGSNMVLQANMVTRVWGECTENGFIAVRLTHTETNEVTVYYGEVKDGYFEMYLGKHDYGGPYKLELITESGKKRTLSNIMFGEVYLAGGQSNMGWTVGQCYGKTTSELRYQEEINNATNPKIRYCSLYPTCGDETKDEVYANETSTNGWAESSPSLVVNISALAFFFATELNRMYDDMPVGIIISCMGGTGIHTWMPADAFEKSHKLPCHDDPNQAGNAAVQGSKYYNKMIHPLRKYVPRGVIWCQGEGQWEYYAENFKILIESWREVFDQPDMYVITASHPRSVNVDDFYRARAEHKKACEMMENATYTNVIDCGLLPKNTAAGDEMNADGTGIHPYDKKPVGERMCYAAMEKFYGAVGTWSGPRYKQMWRNGDEIVIEFDNVGYGLMLQGKAGFEVLGEDGKYYEAETSYLSPKRVSVSVPAEAGVPQGVRYGYRNKPSWLPENEFTDYSQCVCVYNTKPNPKTKAFPLEQFEANF